MNTFLTHAVKAGVFMALFYVVYYLFLSRDTSYIRNRLYLVGSMLVSWILPFVVLRVQFRLIDSELSSALNDLSLLPANYQLINESPDVPGFTPGGILSIVYLAGVGLFALKLAASLLRLMLLIYRSPVTDKTVLVKEGAVSSGFSALGFTFINDMLAASEKEKIILHERIHGRLLHHFDTILCEMVIVLQWMNPFAYLIRYSLRAVHEYQTDREFLDRAGSLREYQELIINEIFGTRSISIASCFSTTSLIKKRILMMTRKKTHPRAAMKLLIAVPFIAAAILLFSCNESSDITSPDSLLETTTADPLHSGEVKNLSADSSTVIADSTGLPIQSVITPDKKTALAPGEITSRPVEYGEMIILIDGSESSAEELARIPDSEIASMRTLDPARALKQFGSRAAAGVVYITTKTYLESLTNTRRDVFMIVENMPTFQGGDVQKFSNWVKERIKYPQIAQENGIQGKVFIGFIVEPDGSISTVTVLRSVDKSLDDEAVRVVQSSPAWAPGYQRGQAVAVRFSITVNFNLNTK